MPGLPESLAVLRLRDFRLLFGAFAVSMVGDRMVSIALAFAVLGLGGSASEVGIVLAARTLPMVGSVLIGGVVADRVSRQRVMVAADLARVVSQGLLAALLIAGEPPIWSLAVLAGLTGAATGFFNPASTGLLPAVVPPEQLQQANGLRATALSGGEIVGPALAGVLVATVGPGWALAIDAATFAVSAAFLVRAAPARAPRARGDVVRPRPAHRMGRVLARGPGCGASSSPRASGTCCGRRSACSGRSSPTATSAARRCGEP